MRKNLDASERNAWIIGRDRTILFVLTVLCMGALAAFPSSVYASCPSAVIGLVDRVEYEPTTTDATTATAVRVYGAFMLALSSNPGYSKPQAGYLYFRCESANPVPTQIQRCRMEWQDIQKTIGTGSCAGLGDQCRSMNYRVRPLQETPANPDDYTVRFGLGVQLQTQGECIDIKNFINGSKEVPSEPLVQDSGNRPAPSDQAAVPPPPDEPQTDRPTPTDTPAQPDNAKDPISDEPTVKDEINRDTVPTTPDLATPQDDTKPADRGSSTPDQQKQPENSTPGGDTNAPGPDTATPPKTGVGCSTWDGENRLAIFYSLMFLGFLCLGRRRKPKQS